MWCISAARLAITWSRSGALMRDSGPSFIKTGIRLCFIRRHLQWSSSNFVDIEYMRNKKDMHFNRILEACNLHGITDLLQFRYN
jgi:hypothetical protein